MSEFDWREFLQRWNDAVLADEPATSLFFPPATQEQIAETERRLKIDLPQSYKSFLCISNGWRRPSPAIERLWPVDELQWFRRDNREWIAGYAVGGAPPMS